MTQDHGEVIVRDLGSTNGIRINGQRVELGRLRPGDELSIAHIRYRLDNGQGHEATMADPPRDSRRERESALTSGNGGPAAAPNLLSTPNGLPGENRVAAAVRDRLGDLADHYRIQVIVQMPTNTSASDGSSGGGSDPAGAAVPAAEKLEACQPDSSP